MGSSLSSSSSNFIASEPQLAPLSNSQVKRPSEVTRWVKVGFEILRCKVFALISPFRNYDATRGAFWSVGLVAMTVVMVEFWILFMWVQLRRRWNGTGSLDCLMLRFKEYFLSK